MANLVVKRINPAYVDEYCAQITLGFRDGMTVRNPVKEEVLFSFDSADSRYINKYNRDKRKEKFPYHTIPVRRAIKGLRLYNMVNVILDFDTTYNITLNEDITYNDGMGVYYEESQPEYFCRVTKDKDGSALFISCDEQTPELTMTSQELNQLKSLGKIKIPDVKEPRIFRFLNRNVTPKDIKSSKKLAKELKKKRTRK